MSKMRMMMKRHSKISMLVIALICSTTIIGLVACSEFEESSPVSSSTIHSLAKGTFALPNVKYNPLNPYDSLGLLHNESLCYAYNHIFDSTTLMTKSIYLDTMMTRVCEYFAERGFIEYDDIPKLVSDGKNLMESDEYVPIFGDSPYLVDYTNDDLSELEVYYIRRVGAVVENYNNSISTIIDSIAVIENEITDVSWPSSEIAAYGIISIAKYSIGFWKGLSDQSMMDGGPSLSDSTIQYAALGDIRSYARPILNANMEIVGWETVHEISWASVARPIVTIGNAIWEAIKWVGAQIAHLWPF